MSTTRATTVIEQPPNAITPAYEPQSIPLESYSGQVSAENESATPFLDRHSNVHHAPDEGNEVGQGPLSGAINVQQHWNEPRSNTWKITAAFFAFMNIGANDASYGALIPSIQEYYKHNYTVVSLVFLSPFVGYSIAALMIDPLHMKFGQRGMAILGPAFRLLAYIVLSMHPPYPVAVVVFAFAGLGNGILDAGYNAWVGNLANTNELLGFMHGFYGIGATISPIVVTTMVSKYHLQWHTFYYVMTGLLVAEMAASSTVFSKSTGKRFRQSNSGAQSEKGRMKAATKSRVTWTVALFLLAYVGMEVSLGGWIVIFMIRVREGEPFASGMTATGFWLGITVGRFALGFVTPRFGERLSVAIYLVLGMALELLFWLVPTFIVSALAIAFLGFFLGPLFPAAIIATTKLLPQRLHVSAVGFASAVGGGGAAVLPFAVGAIAQAKGVKSLQPIILALLGVLLALWLSLPKIPRRAHAE